MKLFIFSLFFLPSIAIAQQNQWHRVKVDSFFVPQQVVFVDSEVGYVAGYQTKYPYYEILYRTSDAGTTWAEIDPYGKGGGSTRLSELTIVNFSAPTRRDIFIGTQTNLCSFDSGNTWIWRNYGKLGGPPSWHMFSGADGYAEDPLGRIVKTYDSAQSWDHVLNYQAGNSIWIDSLHGMYFLFDTLNNSTGYYDTIQGIASGSTSDGGSHWNFGVQPFPARLSPVSIRQYLFSSCAAPNSTEVCLYPPGSPNALLAKVLPYSYLITRDLGGSWQTDTSFAGRVLSMAAIGDAVWLSISSGDTLTRYHPAEWLAMSYDGVHWDIDSTSAKGLNINSITFTDASHGWAVGNDTTTGTPFSDSTVGYVLKYVGASLADVHESQPAFPVLDLSPNPAENLLHFHAASPYAILRAEAVGVLGNSIECPLLSVIGPEGNVNISALAPGMYELRLWTMGGCVSKAFLKLP